LPRIAWAIVESGSSVDALKGHLVQLLHLISTTESTPIWQVLVFTDQKIITLQDPLKTYLESIDEKKQLNITQMAAVGENHDQSEEETIADAVYAYLNSPARGLWGYYILPSEETLPRHSPREPARRQSIALSLLNS
jgi:hypothetical protein